MHQAGKRGRIKRNRIIRVPYHASAACNFLWMLITYTMIVDVTDLEQRRLQERGAPRAG